MRSKVRVGVLALQGSFEPHARAVERLGHAPVLVRSREDLEGLTHLILPGGESTTLHHLLELFGLREAIRERATRGDLALFGTCAGAILMGQDEGPKPPRPPRMGVLDATLARNAYGRQVDSFEAELDVPALEGRPLRAIFIRAPRFARVGANARVLAELDGEPVLVEQGPHVAAAFHPELAEDDRVLLRFLRA